ncbi:type I polyketide synthase [Mycobacterium sp. KBS0706]|uniref:type I polyketide synthase n=1 Tax=Mycobacterium sp. KBS0706 TaxID=2578109 RepID=UPI00163D96F2|nr:type I polyketide synthase [Mycobacterium sp. KBS0706]
MDHYNFDEEIAVAEREPLAIVGMSCRFAPDLDGLDPYWNFLCNGQSAVREVPPERWAPYEQASPEASAVLRRATRRGCFMDGIEDFDAEFFGISAREAESIDPQQRIVLELVWEALEHAGIRPSQLKGSKTGVFAAAGSVDYGHQMYADFARIEPWALNGGMLFGIANRVSYVLDLHGPSLVVDTACAGSLTALHLGCQSLWDGTVPIAVIAGVNIMTFPGVLLALDAAGATSKDGWCKSFDAGADGYGRGEGAGVLILKRLSDAERDHDRVLAVIRTSGIFQDGRTAGMMAPNGDAQELMLRQLYEQARIPTESVQYIEAHGTGTRLGDKAELTALSRVFGLGRSSGAECLVSSVKPNVGHLEAAAGMAGLIKAVISLNRGLLPKNLHRTLNGEIDWDAAGIRIVSELTSWPSATTPRRAGVSNYGVGGSLAHVALEESPKARQASMGRQALPAARLFPFSSRSQESLTQYARKFAHWIEANPQEDLDDIGYTLSWRRDHLSVRAGIIASTKEELLAALQSMPTGTVSEHYATGPILNNKSRGVVFVFSGHGAQWDGMCRELLQNEPVFASELDSLEKVYREELGYSPREALELGDFSSVERTQAMIFAVQIGLTALWASKGLTPAAVIGYSVGEIAAAVAAGALEKISAARFVCRRAAILQRLSGQGGMLMVNLPFDDVKTRLGQEVRVVAAIAASPASTIISGDIGAISQICDDWAEEGLVTRRVATDVAFHSPHIDRVREDIRAACAGLVHLTPTIEMYNTTLNDPRAQVSRDAEFWVRNARDPVLFEQAVTAAMADDFNLYLEVSTRPTVSHSLRETAIAKGREDVVVSPTIKKDCPERSGMMASLANLYCHGADLVWHESFPQARLADLPPTSWNHRKYWTKASPITSAGGRGHIPESHTLLGSCTTVRSTPTSYVWRSQLNFESRPYPGKHPVFGVEIVPAAVLLHSFMQAGARHARLPCLKDISLHTPVAVEQVRDIQLVKQGNKIELASRLVDEDGREKAEDDHSWTTHTTATFAWDSDRAWQPSVEEYRARCTEHVTRDAIEELFQRKGIGGYGFEWLLGELYRCSNEIIATMEVSPAMAGGNSWAAVLDGALTITPLLLPDDGAMRMPAHVAKVAVGPRLPTKFTVLARARDAGGGSESASMDLVIFDDEKGDVAAWIEGLAFGLLDKESDFGILTSEPVFVEHWEELVINGEKQHPLPQLVLLGEESGTALRLAAGLRQAGIESELCPFVDAVPLEKHDVLVIVLGSDLIAGETPEENVERNAWHLMSTIRWAIQAKDTCPGLRVGCLTTGVRGMETQETLGQSVLWGISRIIAGERPDLWGGLYDMEPQDLASAEAASRLQSVLLNTEEDVIAVTARAAEGLRLIPAPAEREGPAIESFCTADATYLVTGGLGALGVRAAQYLVNNGARRLVLTSRRGLPPRSEWASITAPETRATIDCIRDIESQGVTVLPLALDVSDERAVAAALSESALGMPPIKGIVHAAGVFKGGMLDQVERKDLRDVLRPKVNGTLALHKAFPPGSIDFFVLFSSSGQIGRLTGQGSYAAANSFMDGFARYRARNASDRTLSIGWMAWERLGMSKTIGVSLLEARAVGVDAISVSTAFRSWDIAQKGSAAYVAVFRPNISDPAARPLPVLSRLTNDVASDEAPSGADPWASVPQEALLDWLVTDIQRIVAGELRCSPTDVLPKRSLVDMGADSLIMVVLRIRLAQQYKIEMPPTLIWNHPTVEAIARYVRGSLCAGAESE